MTTAGAVVLLQRAQHGVPSQPSAHGIQALKHFILGMPTEGLAVLLALLFIAVAFGIALGKRWALRPRTPYPFTKPTIGRRIERGPRETFWERAPRKLSAWRIPSFQNGGELVVSHLLASHLRPPDYHLMNHVTVRLDDGTTQIDHILVSRFGVFVVETKDFNGWIFGDAYEPRWTRVHFHRKDTFQNPIHQNYRHICAVQAILDFLPANAIKSVVVFSGKAQFKTPLPAGVVHLVDLVDHIQAVKTAVMSPNKLQFCVGRLETARLALSGDTDVEHLQSLSRRFGGRAV